MNFHPDNDVYYIHFIEKFSWFEKYIYWYSADLSSVGEDDTESEDAEDEEARSTGGDDQQVEAGRRRIWGGAVLHCFEVSYTLKQNST